MDQQTQVDVIYIDLKEPCYIAVKVDILLLYTKDTNLSQLMEVDQVL